MKVVKYLAIGLAVLVALFVGIGLLLPGSVHVERSIHVEAPPELVRPLVAGFGRFNEWSPWYDLDPDARYVISGPAEGAGARQEWASNKPEVGSGAQEILEERPGLVRTHLSFAGQGEAIATIRYRAEDNGTRVDWAFDMDLGANVLLRWIGLVMDDAIGDDYAEGLRRLKALAEQDAAAARDAAPDVPAAPDDDTAPAA